jgi:hypothetical protein
MDRLTAMEVLVRVVENGSFSGAAETAPVRHVRNWFFACRSGCLPMRPVGE